MKWIVPVMGSLAALLALPLYAAQDATLDNDIAQLQMKWDVVNYSTANDKQDEAFKDLEKEADVVVQRHPNMAEPLVWKAIILSSHAGATGGLGALGKVKEARRLLVSAEALNPRALDGSIYTSLGSLYYQVPGWPIGFGNDEKAEEYLQKALDLNPNGIDANYFYGDFLLDQGRPREAIDYLQRAVAAPDRPNRAVGDAGRRQQARADLKKAEAKLN